MVASISFVSLLNKIRVFAKLKAPTSLIVQMVVVVIALTILYFFNLHEAPSRVHLTWYVISLFCFFWLICFELDLIRVIDLIPYWRLLLKLKFTLFLPMMIRVFIGFDFLFLRSTDCFKNSCFAVRLHFDAEDWSDFVNFVFLVAWFTRLWIDFVMTTVFVPFAADLLKHTALIHFCICSLDIDDSLWCLIKLICYFCSILDFWFVMWISGHSNLLALSWTLHLYIFTITCIFITALI